MSILFFIVFVSFFVGYPGIVYSEPETKTEAIVKAKPQSKTIQAILKKEKSTVTTKSLIHCIERVDSIYADLYEKLKKGKKIVIFFDPAHGKLANNKWQGGDSTRRSSCTNRPEEFYSILFSREMYKLLAANDFISVKTTDDYLKVLKGESDSYKNIAFPMTVKLAQKENAFIIISEHLNNVSMIHKASGRVNLPGIHITRDNYGRKVLQYVIGTYSGFLTLYNKLDASGFSKKYALKIKEHLVKDGFKANSWKFGAVGDDRFSYFVDFPISVIYESGFISNPEEEKKLRDREHVKKMVTAQYNSLLENIEEVFGVDISGSSPGLSHKKAHHRVELLKLSRIAIMYTKMGKTKKALAVIKTMEKKYKKTGYKDYIVYYSKMKKRIQKGEKYYRLGKINQKRKRYKKAWRYFRKALRSVKYDPVFMAYSKKYASKLHRKRRKRSARSVAVKKTKKQAFIYVKKASRRTPIILAIEENQSLSDALSLALAPDKKTLKKLTKSFKKAKVVKRRRVRRYSKKRGRKITYYKKYRKRVRFKKGIYIVHLNKNLSVRKVKAVRSVLLSPWKYQNQQYLKNSYFATGVRNKAL
ncbi:MAG: hypothetical protein GY754_10820 [bacterium]|nr:hypothetical protein [bacterium]